MEEVKEVEVKIEDLSVVELKAIIWDLEQSILMKQQQRNQVLVILQEKLDKGQKHGND